MDKWLEEARDRLAAASNLSSSELDLGASDEAALLELARLAAHESGERTNAPLLCYILGRASHETALDELAQVLKKPS